MMSNSKGFQKSGVATPSLGNNFTDNQDTNPPSQLIRSSTSTKFNEDDPEMAKTTFDFYNLKKLLCVNNGSPQPSNETCTNSSQPSNLPQPPQHWLIWRTEKCYTEEDSEEEQEMAKKTDTFDYYNLKKLLYVDSYGQLGDRNSSQPNNRTSNVPFVSALPQPPQHWLLGRAQRGYNEDEMEREMAKITSTYDFYNLKMLLTGE